MGLLKTCGRTSWRGPSGLHWSYSLLKERESTLENNEQLNSMETSLKLKNVVIEWIHMPVLTKGTEESVIKPNYSVTKFASLYSTNHLLKIKSWLLFSF